MSGGNLLSLMRQKARLRPAIMQLIMVKDEPQAFDKLAEDRIPILKVRPINTYVGCTHIV
jgi:hypothetical protein